MPRNSLLMTNSQASPSGRPDCAESDDEEDWPAFFDPRPTTSVLDAAWGLTVGVIKTGKV